MDNAFQLQLLGIADLSDRWDYTRQGVHLVIREREFPAPAAIVNRGRIKVWHLTDVQRYEASHPELRDAAAKRRKVMRAFYLSQHRPR